MDDLPLAITPEVRDGCVCLSLQRAARSVARRFDDAFRPFGITNGQFSILVSLHRPQPARVGDVAAVLAMDRTTVTAALKPLERRGLIERSTDPADRRAKRLQLTDAGRDIIRQALPVWRETHRALARERDSMDVEALRAELHRLAAPAAEATDS